MTLLEAQLAVQLLHILKDVQLGSSGKNIFRMFLELCLVRIRSAVMFSLHGCGELVMLGTHLEHCLLTACPLLSEVVDAMQLFTLKLEVLDKTSAPRRRCPPYAR
mmetsp:Transcript_122291/g.216523  ORF Transcript_122291/g.216523 Transcript_122291/m.216523 type:complete len:105 (+) Transcript_122291:478-792(+)